MIRFTVAFALQALVGLMLAAAAAAAGPENAVTDSSSGAAGNLMQIGSKEQLQQAGDHLTWCDVCAGMTCATVQVRGRCTVDKAVEALRRQEAEVDRALSRAPARIRRRDRPVARKQFDRLPPPAPETRHRTRAVSKDDFVELPLGEAETEVGRAEAGPKYGPQGSAGARLLDLHERTGRPLSVREHLAPKPDASPFRPLELERDTSDDGDDGTSEDGTTDNS